MKLDADQICRLCRELRADDVGIVGIDRPELDDQREEILDIFPGARTLIAYVRRMNRESIRTPARSLANLEFHHKGEQVNEIGSRICASLERRGVRALSAAMGFPMEMDRWPRKTWTISHKPVARRPGSARWASTAT